MNSGGITETIWHFAGYLHIAEEVARSATLYSGDPQNPVPDEDPVRFKEPERPPVFDDLQSQPTFIREPVSSDPHPALHKLPAPPPVPIGTKLVLYPTTPQRLELPDEFGFERNVRTTERVITAEYQPGGTEGLVDIGQRNLASDRDVVISDKILDSAGEPVALSEIDHEGTFAAMVAQAEAAVPANLPDAAFASTHELIAVFTERGGSWAETGSPNPDGSPAETAPVGRIVDGEFSVAELPVPSIIEIAPWRFDEAEPAKKTDPLTEGGSTKEIEPTKEAEKTVTAPEPTGGIATLAETGLNTQINAAVILDANEAVGSLMVGGDHYFSRGIVQVNVLTDSDHVDVAVAGSLQPSVTTGGNEVHNVAELITHVMSASVHGAAGTSLWSVDVVSGDFYDVRSITQLNTLDDSDRVVQAESGTYFDLRTGENEQVNLAEVRGLDNYDIIIVGGDYYRADWIYQYNIVLDSDDARLFSAGGVDDSTVVTTGFNRLTNLATIETYDGEFKSMNAAQLELMQALGNGLTVLIPNADWNLYGTGGTLQVLYIPGDYYDINVITQVNLLVDADQIIQASAETGAAQGVANGGNSAINEAHIIDPGTLSAAAYLGGMAYEESVLIQTNIITDTDTVTIHDTQTLITELVAFAHDEATDSRPQNDVPLAVDPAQHDHLMSNMLG